VPIEQDSLHDAIELVGRFASGGETLGPWDWDDFESVPSDNPLIKQMQRALLLLSHLWLPRGPSSEWCSSAIAITDRYSKLNAQK
jgi:hypothetical protein